MLNSIFTFLFLCFVLYIAYRILKAYKDRTRDDSVLVKLLKKLGLACVALALIGCTKPAPSISTIVDPAVNAAEEALDYAKNNIVETDDTRFLTAHLDACKNSLVSCEAYGTKSIEAKDKEIKNRELMLVIVAVIAFVLGRVIKA